MRNFLWFPLLLALSGEFSSSNAQSTILLPTDSAPKFPPRCPAPDPLLNPKPVIGIMSHPGDGVYDRISNATSVSYIAASYVKFVESGGARVIPILYNDPPEIINKKLNLVNGVIFTGGSVKNGSYFESIDHVFQKILERNDRGDHFPLLAMCLGFELLTMIISKDKNILEAFKASDQASTLQFMKNINIEGTVFQRFPPDLLKKLSIDCLVRQNHRFGISPESFQENKDLCGFFKILTTSPDEDNKNYVSTVQANKYPITAFQWHPEKNAFEWGSSTIPHTEDAVRVTHHVANYFVSEVRKSLNRPPVKEVLDNLIYNYSPIYGEKAGSAFDEVYIFNP